MFRFIADIVRTNRTGRAVAEEIIELMQGDPDNWHTVASDENAVHYAGIDKPDIMIELQPRFFPLIPGDKMRVHFDGVQTWVPYLARVRIQHAVYRMIWRKVLAKI